MFIPGSKDLFEDYGKHPPANIQIFNIQTTGDL